MPINPKSQPDFSIIIPTYNRSHFLKLAIFSTLRQKHVSMEIIVGDDSSTDDTEKIVKSFKDKRIRYFKNKKRIGTSMNYQKCFLRSSGRYLFTLGDDDFILDDNTLFEVSKVMRKYKMGMGKIGAISYQNSPKHPYQVSILSDKLIVLKPSITKNILTRSIDFGLGYFSGLIFDNSRLDRKQLEFDHVCNPNHMCFVYFPVAYNLIKKYGIAYIPNHFIISRLSVQLIPKYFTVGKDGRFFMEEPLMIIKRFIQKRNYQKFKRKYLRSQMALLPNIKYYSNNSNYLRALRKMIYLDKTLVTDLHFLQLAIVGFMPKTFIKLARLGVVYYFQKRVKNIIKKYHYFQKIEQFGDALEVKTSTERFI